MEHTISMGVGEAETVEIFRQTVYRSVDRARRRAECVRWNRRHSVSGIGMFPADAHPSLRSHPPSDRSDDEEHPELPASYGRA